MISIIARIGPPTGYVRPANEVHPSYPKWVHFEDKRPSVIVQNKAEHDALLGGIAPTPAPAKEDTAPAVVTLVGSNDDLTILRKLAAEKGIAIDGRWSMKKIRAKIEAASA